MSGQDDQTDKSFEATPQKLLEARKKGEIARSAELLTAASYFGVFAAFGIFGVSGLAGLGSVLALHLGQAAQISHLYFDGAGTAPGRALIQELGRALLPWFAVPMLAVLGVLFATRGIVFAPVKIAPKTSKVSPISNAKNKFGRNGLFQFVLSFLKLVIYSAVLAAFIYFRLEDMLASLHSNPFSISALLLRICMEFLFVVVIVSALIGSVDATWQHFEHLRKNRMSRKEVTDETKNSEGDPHMKQERRQRAQAIAASKMMVDVETADVIVVNPTHFSVALKWDRLPGQAPVCVAKGVDEIALKIREIALEHSVPIHRDPPTARALHATTRIGDQIEPEHYKAVAAAIRFAENMRQKAKGTAW